MPATPPSSGRFWDKPIEALSRDEWEAWMRDYDVCMAPVLDLNEAFHRPQVAAREMLLRDEDGNLHIGNPIKFRHEPARINTRLPKMGEHTGQVLESYAGRSPTTEA